MSRLRKLIPVLAVVALMLIAAVPVLAQLPPAVYLCTAYEDGVLVGAGKTVEAFVGNEATPRGWATTNADGQAVVEFAVTTGDLGQPLSFTVDGNAAEETPNVNVSIEGLMVRLDYTGVPPEYYTLTVTVSPPGAGTVAKNPDWAQYPAGTVVTLTASPIGVGMMFDHWSGAVTGTANPTTVTMNANKSVTAHFEPLVPPPGEGFAWWLYETFVECLVD